MATEAVAQKKWLRVMIKSPVGWKRKFYPRGLQQVPPDLAIALGYDLTSDNTELMQSDEEVDATQLVEKRIAELKLEYFGESGEETNWRPIKELADHYSIPKPAEGGWDEAIEAIAIYEVESGFYPAE